MFFRGQRLLYTTYKLILVYFFVFVHSSVSITTAQSTSIRFEKLTVEQGLSQNTVKCIHQDALGFIWFGTFDGLNRYDGYEFVIYKPDFSDSTSISSNRIECIHETPDGDLWIGTLNGLNKYNPHTDSFARFQHDKSNPFSISENNITSICGDNEVLWIATASQGINAFVIKENKFYRFLHHKNNPGSLSNNYIFSVHIDKDNYLWIATDGGGINRLNLNKTDLPDPNFSPSSVSFTHFTHNKNNKNSIANNVVRCIWEDPDKTLWFGLWNEGICKLPYKNRNTAKFINYTYNKKNPQSLSNNRILTIFRDNKHTLWVGTRNGLNQLLQETIQVQGEDTVHIASFAHYRNNLNDNNSISGNFIEDIFQDESGILWIGTIDEGVNKIKRRTKDFVIYNGSDYNFRNNAVRSVFEDEQHNLWLGMRRNGLKKIERKPQTDYSAKQVTIREYPYLDNNQKETYSSYLLSLEKSQNDSILWLGTDGRGLIKFNKYTEAQKKYQYNEQDSNSIANNYIWCLHEDTQGVLWIGTADRLSIFLPENFSSEKFINYQANGDSNSLKDNLILNIFEDSQGTIWIGTYNGGLHRVFNYNTLKNSSLSGIYRLQFRSYMRRETNTSLNSNSIRAVCESTDGKYLWIGTMGGGVNLFNKKNETFTAFGKSHGLDNDVITSIIEDRNRDIWVSTNKGISRFDSEKQKFKNYGYSNGLFFNAFRANISYKTSTDEIIFAGKNGFVVFYPDSITDRNFVVPVRITDFQIFNKSVHVAEFHRDHKVLTQSIHSTDEVTISYKDNIISFAFAGLDYNNPQNIHYAYMLEGFDNDWIFTDAKRRFASYTNLEGGTYIFKVKATNSDGVWNNNPTTLKVIIKPPFWKTPVFYIIIALLLLIYVFIYIKYREKRLIKDKRNLERRVKARTIEILYQKEEIETQRDEIEKQRDFMREQKMEIEEQNKELEKHRHHLEKLVRNRTHDLEKAKLKAEKSDKLKTAFLTNMSHEIRTPMNAIVGFASLLDDEEMTEIQRKEYIKLIYSNSESLLRLVDDIIDLSKIQAGDIIFMKSEFNLNSFFDDVFSLAEQFRQQMRKNELKIKMDKAIGDDKIVRIFTDRMRLKQIVMNLIENAIKYTDKGSVTFGYQIEKWVDKRKVKQQIKLYVEDTGIGIRKEDTEFIFDRFRKIEHENSLKLYRGTGLGLTICKNLVEMLGGSISVESKKGKGSKFYFTIPQHFSTILDKPAGMSSYKPTKPRTKSMSKTILVAEDETMNFRFIEVILKKMKADILWAQNGTEAVTLFKENSKIDMVLMDAKMPEMDGFQASKEIRVLDKEVPIIMQSAYGVVNEEIQSRRAGCNEFISKPFKANDMINLINKYLDTDL